MASIIDAGTRPVPRKNSFETAAWKYMRWSGILLVPLVFGHLIYMHIVNSVAVIEGAEWVAENRWAYLNVRIYDGFVLWFAGLHGFNGLRVVINDYVHEKRANITLNIGIGILMVIVLFLGTFALVGAHIPGFADGIPLRAVFGGWEVHLK